MRKDKHINCDKFKQISQQNLPYWVRIKMYKSSYSPRNKNSTRRNPYLKNSHNTFSRSQASNAINFLSMRYLRKILTTVILLIIFFITVGLMIKSSDSGAILSIRSSENDERDYRQSKDKFYGSQKMNEGLRQMQELQEQLSKLQEKQEYHEKEIANERNQREKDLQYQAQQFNVMQNIAQAQQNSKNSDLDETKLANGFKSLEDQLSRMQAKQNDNKMDQIFQHIDLNQKDTNALKDHIRDLENRLIQMDKERIESDKMRIRQEIGPLELHEAQMVPPKVAKNVVNKKPDPQVDPKPLKPDKPEKSQNPKIIKEKKEKPDGKNLGNPDQIDPVKLAEDKLKELAKSIPNVGDLEHLPAKPKVHYNPNFIFHTKLPKAGSTTMNAIMKILASKNKFFYAKIDPHYFANNGKESEANKGRTLIDEEPVVNFFKETSEKISSDASQVSRYNKRVVILKHHYPFDFGKYELENPTYINVLREPASWFQSHYYFERYGWTRIEGNRNSFSGTDEDRDRTINECIENNHPDCLTPKWSYLEYICGNKCPSVKGLRKTGVKNLSTLVEQSKYSLLYNFYTVGILENFSKTLKLFEYLMPEVFSGVGEVANSRAIAVVRNNTKSIQVSEDSKLSEENKEVLRKGALKYETDLYNFGKAIFEQQLRKYGLED